MVRNLAQVTLKLAPVLWALIVLLAPESLLAQQATIRASVTVVQPAVNFAELEAAVEAAAEAQAPTSIRLASMIRVRVEEVGVEKVKVAGYDAEPTRQPRRIIVEYVAS